MTFIFKHPKYYKELRERNKSDQVISARETADDARAPGPGHKPQAPSSKPQASSNKLKGTSCSFDKTQAD